MRYWTGDQQLFYVLDFMGINVALTEHTDVKPFGSARGP